MMKHAVALLAGSVPALLGTAAIGAEAETPWQADPQRVESLMRKGGANYREEDVPEYRLPDPLTAADGTRISDADAWVRVRRPEVLNLFRDHVYGHSPDTPVAFDRQLVRTDPNAMGGAATLKLIDLRFSPDSELPRVRLVLFVPNDAPKPVPGFLLICNRPPDNIDPSREKRSDFWPAEEIVARGYAAAAFYNGDVDPDKHDGFADGIHGLLERPEERTDTSWGTLAAWAWGASRALDALDAEAGVDASRIAVVGHSRGGKTALWAGAEDPRFALVISNDSGCGGAALSRRRYGETVARITTSFPHWFCGRFAGYADREEDLPVDQHMLVALIAPRPVYVASAGDDLWADPKGEWLSLKHAEPVYALFGSAGTGLEEMPPADAPVRSNRMFYHLRSGGHNLTTVDWGYYLDAADKVLAAGEP